MAQGYTGYTIVGRDVSIADGPNLDAFSRLRVSNPLTIFANQFTYDDSPLIFEKVFSANATIGHSAVDRLVRLNLVGANNTDYAYMQSYEHIPYQPGRSQLVFISFIADPLVTGNKNDKVVGLGDYVNGSAGFFFVYENNTLPYFRILSTTGAGSQSVPQNNWNLDKLDGTGPSGINIDFSLPQILVIDFQALYAGRVRFGFDIDGQIIYAHEFLNANNPTILSPYIQTANLPIFVGVFPQPSGGGNDLLSFICCSVASEGGTDDAQKLGYNFVFGKVATISANYGVGWDYCMQLRPRTVFNGIVNRTKFILTELEFINLGNRSIKWQLTIGDPATAGSWSDVNTTYSAMEYGIGGSYITGTTIVIDEGYAPATGAGKSSSVVGELANRYPITLDAIGNQRDFGTLTLSASMLAAGTADLFFTMKWKEVR